VGGHQEKSIRLAWSGMSGRSGRSGRFNRQKSLSSHFSQNFYIIITISEFKICQTAVYCSVFV